MSDKITIRLRSIGDGARHLLDEFRHGAVSVVGAEEETDLVVLTPGDLDDLLEDAAAEAAWRRTRGSEAVPVEIADRLLAGEHPVAVWRSYRKLTLTSLAERAGIGKGYLSQIERGGRTGTLDTMRKLATALDVDVDDLI
jgi:DNA-binding Xre family transcriptional regulator